MSLEWLIAVIALAGGCGWVGAGWWAYWRKRKRDGKNIVEPGSDRYLQNGHYKKTGTDG